MDKYFWLALAALCGGVISQFKRGGAVSWLWRLGNLAAGVACAIYGSPIGIDYFGLANNPGQYIIPFAIGAFWLKLYEAVDKTLDGIKFPWGN